MGSHVPKITTTEFVRFLPRRIAVQIQETEREMAFVASRRSAVRSFRCLSLRLSSLSCRGAGCGWWHFALLAKDSLRAKTDTRHLAC